MPPRLWTFISAERLMAKTVVSAVKPGRRALEVWLSGFLVLVVASFGRSHRRRTQIHECRGWRNRAAMCSPPPAEAFEWVSKSWPLGLERCLHSGGCQVGRIAVFGEPVVFAVPSVTGLPGGVQCKRGLRGIVGQRPPPSPEARGMSFVQKFGLERMFIDNGASPSHFLPGPHLPPRRYARGNQPGKALCQVTSPAQLQRHVAACSPNPVKIATLYLGGRPVPLLPWQSCRPRPQGTFVIHMVPCFHFFPAAKCPTHLK